MWADWSPVHLWSTTALTGCIGASSLTLQEKWWWTARLRACFLSATRVAEHFSQHATFRSDLPKPGFTAIAPLHIVPLAEETVLLMRSPRIPGRDLYDGTASALWHIFRCGSPLVPPPPSGVRRTLGGQSFPLTVAEKPTGSRWCCTSELWETDHYKKDVCGLWQWEIRCQPTWTTATTPKCCCFFFLQCNNIVLIWNSTKTRQCFFKCEQIISIMNKSDLPSALLWQEICPLFQSQMTWQLVNI